MTMALRVLADENINPAVFAGLRKRGWDIRPGAGEQLVSGVDADVLARLPQRVVQSGEPSFPDPIDRLRPPMFLDCNVVTLDGRTFVTPKPAA